MFARTKLCFGLYYIHLFPNAKVHPILKEDVNEHVNHIGRGSKVFCIDHTMNDNKNNESAYIYSSEYAKTSDIELQEMPFYILFCICGV